MYLSLHKASKIVSIQVHRFLSLHFLANKYYSLTPYQVIIIQMTLISVPFEVWIPNFGTFEFLELFQIPLKTFYLDVGIMILDNSSRYTIQGMVKGLSCMGVQCECRINIIQVTTETCMCGHFRFRSTVYRLYSTVLSHASIANFSKLDLMLFFEKIRLFQDI